MCAFQMCLKIYLPCWATLRIDVLGRCEVANGGVEATASLVAAQADGERMDAACVRGGILAAPLVALRK